MSGNDFDAFRRFCWVKRNRFKAIAWKTDNEYTPEDIEGEAWLMAPQVAEKLAIRLDFDDPLFQDCLISFLYNELTTYTETVVRHAVKLDRQFDGEDVSIDDHPAMRKLAANEFSDPLRHLIVAEEASEEPREHGPHESRAGAYIHLLRIFDNRMREVAEHLLISRSYCYFRYNEALAMVQRQLPLPGEGLVSESAEQPKPWRPFRAMRRWVQVEFDFYATSELFSKGR